MLLANPGHDPELVLLVPDVVVVVVVVLVLQMMDPHHHEVDRIESKCCLYLLLFHNIVLESVRLPLQFHLREYSRSLPVCVVHPYT